MSKQKFIEKIDFRLSKLAKLIPSISFGMKVRDEMEKEICALNLKNRTREIKISNTAQSYILEKQEIYLTQSQWHLVDNKKMAALRISKHLSLTKDKNSYNIDNFSANDILANFELNLKNTKILQSIASYIKIESLILREISNFIRQFSCIEEISYCYIFENSIGRSLISNLFMSMTTSTEKVIINLLQDKTILKSLVLPSQNHFNDTGEVFKIMCLLMLKKILKDIVKKENSQTHKEIKKLLLEIFKEHLDTNASNAYNQIVNTLTLYRKVLGQETLTLISTSKYVKISTIKTPKKIINAVDFDIPMLILNISAVLPNFSKKKPKLKTHFYNDMEYLIQNKEHIDDPFGEITISQTLKNNIDKIYSTSYALDLQTTLVFLTNLNKILNNINNPEKLTEYDLKFLSEMYEINFLTLKKKLSITTFNKLINFALDFNINLVNFKKHAAKFDFLQKIKFKINGVKLIYNDIFINMVVNLKIKKFLNEYFLDFRGRNYPKGTFNFLSGRVRNFICFSHINRFSFGKIQDLQKTQILELLTEQVYSNLQETDITEKHHADLLHNFLTIKEIPKLQKFYAFNYKVGSLFTIYKLIIDLKRLLFNAEKKFKDLGFCSFFSLDSSSSGAQIIAILLRSKKLAKCVQLSAGVDTPEKPDWYTTIAEGLKTEFNDTILPLYNTVFQLFPFFKDVFNVTELMSKEKSSPIDIKVALIEHFINNNLITFKNSYTNEIHELFVVIFNDLDFAIRLFNSDAMRFFVKKFFNSFNIEVNAKLLKYLREVNLLSDLTSFSVFDLPLSAKILHDFCFRVKLFWAYLMVDYLFYLNEGYKIFGISRSLVKHPVMTALYGSTNYGKQHQMIDSVIKEAIKTGYLFIDPHKYFILTQYSGYLATLMDRYIAAIFSPGIDLINWIKKNKLEISTINSKDITYTYEPYILKTFVKKKFTSKAYRISYRTSEIDYKDLSRCFLANYIQHHDALLVYSFYNLIVKSNSVFPCYTLHDRYGCHPYYAPMLKPMIKCAYEELITNNLYAQHFKTVPELVDLQVTSDSPDFFTIADFNSPNFCKM